VANKKEIQIKTDGRKLNGGFRIGAGRKEMPEKELKATVIFYIKKKHVAKAKKIIQPIVDEINSL
jgi:hypothetical protein